MTSTQQTPKETIQHLIAVINTILDQVDYTAGACSVTEMVGAVLPTEVIALAKTAVAEAK